MVSIADSSVTIQTASQSVPSAPVLATWDIRSQNCRVAPVHSLSSLTLTRLCCSAEEASLALCKHAFRGLCCSRVGIMQSTQHANGDHLIRLMWWRSRKPLPDPLMWPGLIEVQDIGLEKPGELLLMKIRK